VSGERERGKPNRVVQLTFTLSKRGTVGEGGVAPSSSRGRKRIGAWTKGHAAIGCLLNGAKDAEVALHACKGVKWRKRERKRRDKFVKVGEGGAHLKF